MSLWSSTEPTWTAPEDIGGKATSLVRMLAAGLTVPPFAVIRMTLADRFHAPDAEAIGWLLEAWDGLKAVRVAVRSSALGEDGTRQSHAGQFETILGVLKGDLAAAVKRCLASAHSARVAAYRDRHGLNGESGMAVIIQALVEAEVSGVAFSADPGTGRRDHVIVAATWGLGEPLVSGRLTGDTFDVDGAGGVTAAIGSKPVRLDGSGESPVPLADQEVACLDEPTVQEIASQARRLARLWGRPIDIEWALAEGTLHLLQARPITALPPDPAGVRVAWDGSTPAESFPAVTTPMTFSFAARLYRAAYRDLARTAGLRPDELDACEPVLGGMLGFLQGRIVIREEAWSGFARILVGKARLKWGVEQRVVGWMAYQVREQQRLVQGLETLGLGDLASRLEDLERTLFKDAGLTVATDLEVIASYTRAADQLVLLGIDPQGPDGTALLASDGLEGAAGTMALWQLAERIKATPGLPELFDGAPMPVARRIASDPAHSALREVFEDYGKRFGWRGAGEMLLERLPPAGRPEVVVAQIQALLAALGQQPRDRAYPLNVELPRKARRAVDKARAWIGRREGMRAARAGIFAAARKVLREIGERMAEIGALPDTEAIWYLGVEELLAFVHGRALGGDPGGAAELRRREYLANKGGHALAAIETVSPASWPAAQKSGDSDPDGPLGILRGVVAWPGRVAGIARVVHDPELVTDIKGDILVAERTDPGWSPLFPTARAIAVEHGSPLSHAAILARELHIPAVIGVGGLMARVRDGDTVVVDGMAGEVRHGAAAEAMGTQLAE